MKTSGQRSAASERMIAMWADPEFKKARTEINRRSATPERGRKIGEQLAKHYVVTAEGGQPQTIKNLNAFCRDHGLDQAAMIRVAAGSVKSHKGFDCRLATITETRAFGQHA